jgi:hypothetical protein
VDFVDVTTSYEELEEMSSTTSVPDSTRSDLDPMIAVGRFWGTNAVKRFRFAGVPERREPSMKDILLHKLWGGFHRSRTMTLRSGRAP